MYVCINPLLYQPSYIKPTLALPVVPTILYPFRSMPHVLANISINVTNSNHKPLRFTIAEYMYVLEGNIKFSCKINSTRGTDVFL